MLQNSILEIFATFISDFVTEKRADMKRISRSSRWWALWTVICPSVCVSHILCTLMYCCTRFITAISLLILLLYVSVMYEPLTSYRATSVLWTGYVPPAVHRSMLIFVEKLLLITHKVRQIAWQLALILLSLLVTDTLCPRDCSF